MSKQTHRIVRLTCAERKLVDYLARMRSEYHLRTRPDSITLFGQLQNDYIRNMERSIGAEIAFCKAMNVFPCTEVVDRANYDARLPSGLGVDVKSTANPKGPLIAKLKPHMDLTDLYAQVLTDRAGEGVYTITGFIEARRAITDRFFVNVPNPYYSIPQIELSALEGL